MNKNSDFFKSLFLTVIFKRSYKELDALQFNEMEELLRSVYKEIRTTVEKHKKVPYELALEMKIINIPNKNLRFSYLELFKRTHKCYKFTNIGKNFLKNMEACMSNLLAYSKSFNNPLIIQSLIGNKSGSNKDTFIFFNTSINNKNLNHQNCFDISNYKKTMLHLYKQVLVLNRKFPECCTVLDNKDREIMQEIPVRFDTLTGNIVNGHMEAQKLFDDLSIGWGKYLNQSYQEAILLDYYLQIG